MNVYESAFKCELAARNLSADRIERRADRIALGRRDESDMGEHRGVCLRATNINGREARIETDRLREFLDTRVGFPFESASPRLRHDVAPAGESSICKSSHHIAPAAGRQSPSTFAGPVLGGGHNLNVRL